MHISKSKTQEKYVERCCRKFHRNLYDNLIKSELQLLKWEAMTIKLKTMNIIHLI